MRRGRHARRARSLSNVVSSQGVHDRYGGVVPEIAVAPSPRAGQRGRRRRAGARGDDPRRRRRWSRSPRARGWWARCWSASRRPRALAAARRLPLAAVDHLQGHVAANFLGARAVRAAVPVPDRVGRAHAAGARDRPPRLRGARADARRRGRARRSTRARACSASASRAGRRCRGWPPTATRARSRSRPPRACAGLDFSFAGLKTALLYKVRDLGRGRDRAPARPTSPRPTSTRSSRR